MSHITKIKLIIKDLDSADKTARRLGLELVRNQKTFRGYTVGRCDHVLRVVGSPNAYEIGLVKRQDGKGYDLAWDADMGQYAPALPLYEKVGYDKIQYGKTASAAKLLDWYAAEVARKQMAKQGFMVRTVQRDRKVQVLCSK
jgi:hypothetical protein